MLTKKISPQRETDTSKLCLSVVLKYFWGNSQRPSLFNQKSDISETSTEIHRKLVFLTMFERGKSWGKFGFV